MPRVLRAALGAASSLLILAACDPATERSDEESAHHPEETQSDCADYGPAPPDGGIVTVEAAHLPTEVVVEVGLTEIDPDIDQEVTVTLATQERAWSYDVDRWVRRDGPSGSTPSSLRKRSTCPRAPDPVALS